jgi:energy-coupling factor transporter ATP-binding protein EcfA2
VEEISVDFDNLTVLIGKNDAGKSAIFDALAIFFDEAKMDADDASKSGDQENVRIVCEFDELPEQLILDADFPTSLSNEYLLNENGMLEIRKVYNGSLKTPKLKGIYAYANHPTVEGLNDLLSLKNQQLKARGKELGIDLKPVDERVNTSIRQRLWQSAKDLKLARTEIPLAEDQSNTKKIWEQLSEYLPSFALFKVDRASTDQDEEAQDPMKAAIKEALKQREADIQALTKHVEDEVRKLADETVEKIRQMDSSLAKQLKPQFTANWNNVFKISLTGDEDIPVNKRGSGIRRLILLNFFRAKAEQAARDKGSSNLIYIIEEPETNQHPNNQKMLMHALYQLSETPGCQVITSTHTPVLARLMPAKYLRYISIEDNGRRKVCKDEPIFPLIVKSLGVLPDHDVKVFVGVEGINDINFMIEMSRMLISCGLDIPNLEQLEQDGKIVFFPVGGSNLTLWTSRLVPLNRPELYIFDRDNEPPAVSKNQKTVDKINKKKSCKAFLTSKREMENYLHPIALKSALGFGEVSFGDFDDVPWLVAKVIHENSESDKSWDLVTEKNKEDKMRKAKSRLNTEVIRHMNFDMLAERDSNGDVLSWFNQIREIVNS